MYGGIVIYAWLSGNLQIETPHIECRLGLDAIGVL